VRLVVADTNVLVSAIQFGSKPKHLLDLAADGQVDLAISEAILEENASRPERQVPPHGRRTQRDRQAAPGHRRTVTPTESINAVAADPSDNRVLECAVAADAEVILSGDKHLLALGSFRGIPIQRVGEFLATFQAGRRVGP
jgi:putative PIN family toxin of toxin-antitoxin system